MTDFGIDIAWTGDLEPMMQAVDGLRALQQSIMRRLTTARGSLFYDLEYGTDLKRFLNSAASPRVIEQAAENEILKDERVLATSVEYLADSQSESRVRISVQTAEGPFSFTVPVSEITAEKLENN